MRVGEREVLVDSPTPLTFPGGGIQNHSEIPLVVKPETMSRLLADPDVGINLPTNQLSIVFFYQSTSLTGPTKIDYIRNTLTAQIARVRSQYERDQKQNTTNYTVSPNLVTLSGLIRAAQGNSSASTQEQQKDLLGALTSLAWAEAAKEALDYDRKVEHKPLDAKARDIILRSRPVHLA